MRKNAPYAPQGYCLILQEDERHVNHGAVVAKGATGPQAGKFTPPA
jgi:hypothetical protein